MTRRQLARILVAFVACWPLVTLGLQVAWDVDPWKLMSFGMYATPGRRPEELKVKVEVQKDGLWHEVAAEVRPLQKWRVTLGTLAPIEPLARAVCKREKADKARVTLRWFRLDPNTARVVVKEEVFDYQR